MLARLQIAWALFRAYPRDGLTILFVLALLGGFVVYGMMRLTPAQPTGRILQGELVSVRTQQAESGKTIHYVMVRLDDGSEVWARAASLYGLTAGKKLRLTEYGRGEDGGHSYRVVPQAQD